MQKLCPGPQALAAVQQKQQAVTQAWESLRLRMEQRKAQLEQAYLLVQFHTAVRTFIPCGQCICVQRCTSTGGLQFWKKTVIRRVCGPGKAGLDDGRETK